MPLPGGSEVGARLGRVRPDDLVCYCYKVSLRKLVHFAQRERPDPVSRMSECLDAGTGCGWCIPFLKRIAAKPDLAELLGVDPAAYEASRKGYIDGAALKNRY